MANSLREKAAESEARAKNTGSEKKDGRATIISAIIISLPEKETIMVDEMQLNSAALKIVKMGISQNPKTVKPKIRTKKWTHKNCIAESKKFHWLSAENGKQLPESFSKNVPLPNSVPSSEPIRKQRKSSA